MWFTIFLLPLTEESYPVHPNSEVPNLCFDVLSNRWKTVRLRINWANTQSSDANQTVSDLPKILLNPSPPFHFRSVYNRVTGSEAVSLWEKHYSKVRPLPHRRRASCTQSHKPIVITFKRCTSITVVNLCFNNVNTVNISLTRKPMCSSHSLLSPLLLCR